MFADKYNLTLEQNVFLAKKNLVQIIHNSARLEECNITYPETKTILDGVSIGGTDYSPPIVSRKVVPSEEDA